MTNDDWICFPDYRETVPYQDLLAFELRTQFGVSFLWIEDAIQKCKQGGRVIFHLHWQNGVYSRATNDINAIAAVEKFESDLRLFKGQGGRFIWTVHNLHPHENSYPEAELAVKTVIKSLADVVHVHNETTAFELVAFGFDPRNIVVYPHPNLISAYPNEISNKIARKYFEIPDDYIVFSFLGMMRSYKGVDILRNAFKLLQKRRPETALVIAGNQGSSSRKRCLSSDGVYTIPRYVEDSTIQYVFNACDFGVLPYRQITTSGALILGLGFGRPMIVPNLPPLLDVVKGGREVLTFEAGQVDDLAATMIAACDLPLLSYRKMCRSAVELCSRLTFRELAASLNEKLKGF